MDEISRSEQRENNANRGGVTGSGFMPGKSGNPGGRPKKKPLTAALEKIYSDPKP